MTTFAEDLRQKGFDICVPVRPEWYNDLLDEEGLGDLIRLPTENVSTGYLIGNTRNFWATFVEWCRARYDGRCEDLPLHPVDTYTQESIEQAVESFSEASQVFYAANCSRETIVSMQRVAVVSGFAYHDRNTQLTIHPKYGTWHAYRAVVVFFGEHHGDSALLPPARVPNLLSPEEELEALKAMQYALSLTSSTINGDLCQQLHKSVITDKDKAAAWIRIRDCVGLGKQEHRYEENQLLYHYTKDKMYLRNAIRGVWEA